VSWQLLTATALLRKRKGRESAAETILGKKFPKGEKSDGVSVPQKLHLSLAGDGKRWKTLPGARANFPVSAGKKK